MFVYVVKENGKNIMVVGTEIECMECFEGDLLHYYYDMFEGDKEQFELACGSYETIKKEKRFVSDYGEIVAEVLQVIPQDLEVMKKEYMTYTYKEYMAMGR